MSRLDDILGDAKKEIEGVISADFAQFGDAPVRDYNSFILSIQADLTRWIALHEANPENFTANDIEDLVKGKKDLLVLKALTQAGANIQKVKNMESKILLIIISAIARALTVPLSPSG